MHKLILILVIIISNTIVFPSSGTCIQTIKDHNVLSLQCVNTVIVIDEEKGSRIVSFKLDENELLGTASLNPVYFGSTLWLSPQGKWPGQGILDDSRYTVEVFNGTDLRLKSQNDSLRGFSFMKHFHVNKADTSVVIKYTITNISKDMQQVAPWEVTRVPTGGLAFCPKNSRSDIPVANLAGYPLPEIIDTIGTIWCPYDSSPDSAQKLFLDGGEGWIAYVRQRMLFIKNFPVTRSDMAAPKEKGVEIYINKEGTYLELENQGIYQKLTTGESLFYEVKWFARRLPANINAEVGNRDLLNYVRSIVERNYAGHH